MDLSKDIQAIQLLYEVYWDERSFLSFDDFYKRYLKEKKGSIEKFKKKTTMCNDCFDRGLKARIYRTWASIITQIHAGYVAESVFGKGTVFMSEKLDHKGVDIQVKYRENILNYQVKKTTHSGVISRKPLSRKPNEGESIDIKYEIPACLSDPKTKKGEFRVPYLRFLNDKRTTSFENGFVIFTPYVFLVKKEEIDKN